MGEVLKEIQATLDDRHTVVAELLRCMENALRVYQVRANTKKPEVNIPRCSKEHLGHIVKELTAYKNELEHIRCELPRVLENGSGLDVD